MKNRIIKIVSLILSLVCLLSGCALGGTKTQVVVTYPEGKEAQAVIAFNPILYLDGESVVAVNDINTAITTDAKAKTLTSLAENTNWKWVSQSSDGLISRATYTLNNWRNRGNISNSKLKAYSYNSDGTMSLMSYATSHIKIESYNSDSFPEMGILMSTSGDKQENLSYVVENDCSLEIPAGTLTIVKSVGGVETGFLDNEDGSDRTAVVNIMVNNTVLWSGEFGKSVGENGEEVTFLEYPAFYDLPLLSGDVISFGIQLNGKKAEELYGDDIEENDTPVIEESDNISDAEIKELSFVDGYDSRFEIVYPDNASIAVQKLANNFFTKLSEVTETSIRLKTDDAETYPASEYEILIGETNRTASKEVYSQIRGYRKNYANDYIVTVKGKHIVIAAGSDIALEKAIEFFVTTYLKDDKSSVPTDMYNVSRPKVRTLSIGGIDITKYVIRTEKYPSILTKRAAKDLSEFFITECGIVVPVENDQKTTANEILVGLTERSGISATVFKKQSLDYVKGFDNEQYKIHYTNGKLFAEAGSDYSANYAVNLIINEFRKSNDLSATFSKIGKYSTSDDNSKYSLSDGYGFAWSDEFLSSTIDGTPINNELVYWTDEAPAGDDSIPYAAYKPDSKLVLELLDLDASNPLKNFLGEKAEHDTHGEYYPFGKMYQGGIGKTYGVSNNLLYQTTKFDTKTGFWKSLLNTKKTMSFRYGIFEVRQIVGAAKGTSAALWLSGASGLADDCEIDIYENFGGPNLLPNLHTWANYHTNHTNHDSVRDFIRVSGKPAAGENFYDTFHYIGMEWSKDYLDFYLDGEIFCAVPMTEEKWYAFEQKVYPKIDLGVIGGFYLFENGYIGTDGGIEELLNFECTQYTDYVRIFQKNGERHRVWDYIAD